MLPTTKTSSISQKPKIWKEKIFSGGWEQLQTTFNLTFKKVHFNTKTPCQILTTYILFIGADAGRAYDDNIDENTYGGVAQLIYVTV